MPSPTRAGRFDIADIVRDHRDELALQVRLSSDQKRVLTDISQCRTSALGGHLDRCTRDTCDYERPSYNSCRNRHCPKCPALAQQKWLSEQPSRMLDVPYFHVVFTLPAELRPLAAFAKRVVYDALFFAAQRTLLEFAERRKHSLGATLVLHTWTRELVFHPHVHAVVTGGGVKGDRWVSAHRRYLFPIHSMAKVFRAKMLERLTDAYEKGDFKRFAAFDDPQGFDRLVQRCCAEPWVVYAKPSFRKATHVVRYLGAYTHRVGIANSRLRTVNEHAVTFGTKNGNTLTVRPVEFLRRLVQHVLPPGFHKIRHVGLHASNEQRARAHAALNTAAPLKTLVPWQQRFAELTGRGVCVCPKCGAPIHSLPLPEPKARDSPVKVPAA